MKIPTVEESNAVLKESVGEVYKKEADKIKSLILSVYNLGRDSCRIELLGRERRFLKVLWNMIFMDFISADKKWEEILYTETQNNLIIVSFKD